MTQPESLDNQAPEADAAEQATPADPTADEDTDSPRREWLDLDTLSVEAPEWDVQEQMQTVRADDDDR
jgi:hypothetical protein